MSSDYHDYVIKDGKLIAEFELMYQKSKETPWHQDSTAHSLFTDIDIAIINSFFRRWKPVNCSHLNMLDLGCGLGYTTERLRSELVAPVKSKWFGFDISPTAVEKASHMFPKVEYHAVDILDKKINSKYKNKFDFIYIKDIIWYVCDKIDLVVENLKYMLSSQNGGGIIYILQFFPDKEEFYGKDVFPSEYEAMRYFSKHFKKIYFSSTREQNTERVYGDSDMDRYFRFYGGIL